MRSALVIALLLLLPSAAAQANGRDYAEEVRSGADVQMYLTYEGGATSSLAGAQDPYKVRETRSHSVKWEGPIALYRAAPGAPLSGGLTGEWEARASNDRVWDFASDSSSLHEERHCSASGYRESFALQATATPEDAGLRVVLTGYVVPNLMLPTGCHTSRVETTLDGKESREFDGEFGMNIPLLHGLKGTDYDARVEFVVPYDGRAHVPFEFSAAVPHAHDTPGGVYCAMPKGAQDWATGSCSASGLLVARVFVDPCPYIKRVYPQHHAELAGVPPPPNGADEAAVRAWVEPNGELVRQVLGDQRAWQLVGCAGDLEPDPWDALARVLKLQRDALLQLLREGKLSREGIGELLGAERSLQLIGASDDSSATMAEVMAASPAAPPGTMEVSVHSPVSLHAWSEDEGHVGWNEATNASESTIPGATYEGAPGGAQTIRLPAGIYKVTVDELERGSYLFEVATNGTGNDATEATLVESARGRTTSTHYAVTVGWDGPRLDAFPVRRGATTGEVAFVDEGRPSISGAPSGGGTPAPSHEDDAGKGKDAPAPGVALAVLSVVALALARSRRR